jgi:hypothetical protein
VTNNNSNNEKKEERPEIHMRITKAETTTQQKAFALDFHNIVRFPCYPCCVT